MQNHKNQNFMILQFNAIRKYLHKKEFQPKREEKKHLKTLFEKLKDGDYLNF
ncbi:hypothetical protein KUL118_20580 [Tenacibaculum sp. KUL118]|uniref:Uncharacterized protein n=1 Tax=Tenacibaculum sp. Pbs-1 TaxID=3238748 RepID=A0AB33KUI4_9FLAO|nr:hypothetical protein BACT7_27880 [Tenacibaculum mesophilum]GFD74439.1 hypothetical protein KUL113_38590 [Tenacibaculum sp. KUL113]GFD79196.1 hypothetical protein KUL118_20580 [Tenacibaculum sp. KUL118]